MSAPSTLVLCLAADGKDPLIRAVKLRQNDGTGTELELTEPLGKGYPTLRAFCIALLVAKHKLRRLDSKAGEQEVAKEAVANCYVSTLVNALEKKQEKEQPAWLGKLNRFLQLERDFILPAKGRLNGRKFFTLRYRSLFWPVGRLEFQTVEGPNSTVVTNDALLRLARELESKGRWANHVVPQDNTPSASLARANEQAASGSKRLMRTASSAVSKRALSKTGRAANTLKPLKPRSNGRNGWIADFHPPATREQQAYFDDVKCEIDALRADSYKQAEQRAEQNIVNSMGALTERFGATSSYLFLRNWKVQPGKPWIEVGTPLKLHREHNTGIKAKTPPSALPCSAKLEDEGITGHVAVTQRPFLANDVRKVTFYKASVRSTRSQLTVPIFHRDPEEPDRERSHKVIGVLNLESNRLNAFLEPHRGELMAAATKLASDILVLHYLQNHKEAYGWHPDCTGWTLERLLDAFCAKVAGSLKTPDDNRLRRHLPRPSCTVWYAEPDSPANELHVRSTARFDYEYLNRQSLDANSSFTGLCTKARQGQVLFGATQVLESFARKEKCKVMGMVYAFATPIVLPNDQAPAKPVGSVNLYFFSEELPEALGKDVSQLDAHMKERFPRQLAVFLAEQVAILVHGCQRLRVECASADLRYHLHEHALANLTAFEIIKDVVLKCLDADYCSLFARECPTQLVGAGAASASPAPLGLLRCVATTGLRTGEGAQVAANDAVYDLDALLALEKNRRGISFSLVERDPKTIRARSPIPHWTGKHSDDGHPTPINKYLETFPHTDTGHHPMVGAAVEDCTNLSVRAAGIIRVLRNSGSKPFVKKDEELLLRLGHEAYSHFSQIGSEQKLSNEAKLLLCGARYPFALRVIGQTPVAMKLDALDRLGSGFPAAAIWNRRHVESVLFDLLTVYRNDENAGRSSERQGGLIANCRLSYPQMTRRVRTSPHYSYKIYAIHRVRSPDSPTEEEIKSHEGPGVTIGRITLEQKCPVTFDSKASSIFRDILPESKDVTSGLCMPIRFLSPNGAVWGVLSLDSDTMGFDQWRSEHLEVVTLAAKKLDFIGRGNTFPDVSVYSCGTWAEGLQSFLQHTLRDIGVGASSIVNERGCRFAPHLDKVQAMELEERVRRCRCQPIKFVNDVGCTMKGAFQMSLWFGAFKTGLKLIGLIDSDRFEAYPRKWYLETMAIKLAEISHLWNRFVSSHIAVGVKPLFKVSFEEKPKKRNDTSKGLKFWSPHVSLGPGIFDRRVHQGRLGQR